MMLSLWWPVPVALTSLSLSCGAMLGVVPVQFGLQFGSVASILIMGRLVGLAAGKAL